MSFFMPTFRKGEIGMASRIKGITVEIGGDTTGLDKALKMLLILWLIMPIKLFQQPLTNG